MNKREIYALAFFSESCAPDEKNGIEKLCASASALPPQGGKTMHYTLDCLYIY